MPINPYKTKQIFAIKKTSTNPSFLYKYCLEIYYLTSLTIIEAFCPPKPNEFDNAA